MDLSVLNVDKCYDLAIELATTAGKIIKDAIKRTKTVEMKTSARDLVTETDKAVEDLVIKSISEAFPSHKFIGEESVSAGVKCALTDSPTWIIDPVDGTMNFVHSFPYTCISIGFWVDKAPVFGVVNNPILDQMFTARKGQGAFLNGEPIKTSGITDISKALIFTEMGTRPDPRKMEVIHKNFGSIMKVAHGIRSMGAAALNMCHIALGGIDGYYEIGIHAWDMAAGVLIIKEAGGYICDADGKEFDVMNRRVLCASTKELAEKLVSILEIYEEERD